MTAATIAPKFRYIGITDECIVCEKCGKPGLKSTVILAILDADGNPEDATYYGSSCAARALGIKGGSRSVLNSARAAHDQTIEVAKDARAALDRYGLPHTGEVSDYDVQYAALLFATKHAHQATNTTGAQWRQMVREFIAARQGEVRNAALLGR